MRWHRYLMYGISLALALIGASMTGCQPRGPTEEGQDKPGDLILNLGDNVKMRFIKINPLNLFVGRYEVANKQYRRFKPDHHSGQHKQLDLNGDNQPAVNVSWNDAQKFCDWLNTNYSIAGTQRYYFRLPKEQEWETFAACGKQGEYPWGAQWPPPRDWNYFGRENPEVGQKLDHDDGARVSCPVLNSGENEWRLFGVGGNVWEWCQDADEESKARVFKGASWADCAPLFLKISRRSSNMPDYRYVNLGFRVVADISEISAEELKKIAEERKKRKAEAQAEKARKEAEAAQKAAESKAKAERAKYEKKTADQTLIIKGLMEDKDFDLASAQLNQYEKDYGQDEFYKKWLAFLENTRVFPLSESVSIEFVRIKPLNIWMGKYEVTNKQYKQFRPDHRSGMYKEFPLDEDHQPVVKVSWNDAIAFCQWMNTLLADDLETNQEFRLPTEREWETAATGGQSRDYPWGNQWPPKYGNYGMIEGYDDGFPVSCPVDESGQNEWEVYGMGGNVWEWCADAYDASRQFRVIRGGAWNLSQSDSLKMANRIGDSEAQKNNYIGFRVVLGPKIPSSQ